jgi:hypothetical protein
MPDAPRGDPATPLGDAEQPVAMHASQQLENTPMQALPPVGGLHMVAELQHEGRRMHPHGLRPPAEPRPAAGQGTEAKGHPDRPAGDARPGALHPLRPLHALPGRGDAHERAGHLRARRPLRHRPGAREDARQSVLGQRGGHLSGGCAHQPRLPLPGARLVPGAHGVRLRRLRQRLQHRDLPPRGADLSLPAARQPRREPVLDVRRGPDELPDAPARGAAHAPAKWAL